MSHTETTEAVERIEEMIKNMHEQLTLDCWSPECECSGGEKVESWLRTALTTIRKETLEEALDASWDWIVEATHKGEWGREDYKQYVRDRLQALKK